MLPATVPEPLYNPVGFSEEAPEADVEANESPVMYYPPHPPKGQEVALASTALVQQRVAEGTGLYGNVTYPAPTLFVPPIPPSFLLPRYVPPPRPGPVYKNKLEDAGPREHEAQKEVARMWRGIQTRRKLAIAQQYDHVINRRATMIQCWWRQLTSKWKKQMLQHLVAEWAVEKQKQLIQERITSYRFMMVWPRAHFEHAARVIQQFVRWFLRRQLQRRQREEGTPEESLSPEIAFPPLRKKTRFFPWRKPRHHHGLPASMEPIVALVGGQGQDDEMQMVPQAENRTLLQFKQHHEPVLPPTQEEVEAINDTMRQKEQQQRDVLAQQEVQSRQAWKDEGLAESELDFNAAIIQRMFARKRAAITLESRTLLQEYLDKQVRIIQRTFRMYTLKRRMFKLRGQYLRISGERNASYARANIYEINARLVWERQLLNKAALTIQKCWSWYKTKVGADPFPGGTPVFMSSNSVSVATSPAEVPGPCFHLLDKYFERNKRIDRDTKTLLQQQKENGDARHRKLFRYKPQPVLPFTCPPSYFV